MVNTKIWKFITPIWEKEPQLTASLVHSSRVNGSRKDGEAKAWRRPAAAVAADGPE
jgi:hypothetical protein